MGENVHVKSMTGTFGDRLANGHESKDASQY